MSSGGAFPRRIPEVGQACGCVSEITFQSDLETTLASLSDRRLSRDHVRKGSRLQKFIHSVQRLNQLFTGQILSSRRNLNPLRAVRRGQPTRDVGGDFPELRVGRSIGFASTIKIRSKALFDICKICQDRIIIYGF
jgi:hypothetical protein